MILNTLINEKFHAYTEHERDLILNEIKSQSVMGDHLLEKIRKYVSLHGRNIHLRTKITFPVDHLAHLRWLTDCLETGLTKYSNDQALINAMLYLTRYATPSQKRITEIQCSKLEDWLLKTPPVQLPEDCVCQTFKEISNQNVGIGNLAGIVIISPSPFSLYTLTVYQILKMLNVPVAAIVLRQFTIERFTNEFSRDGFRLIKKIWRKLVLRGNENPDKTEISIKKISDDLCLKYKDIRNFARTDRVEIIKVKDFKDHNKQIKSLDPNIGIFTGGGMIGNAFLSHFRNGVINTHMGSLPRFKGMDVVEAPILEGYFDDITLTSHVMVQELDAGPIVQKFKISSHGYDSLGSLRNELSAVIPFIAVDSALGLLSGRLQKVKQPELGRQYYFLHPRLQQVLKSVIARRFIRSSASIPKKVCDASLTTLHANSLEKVNHNNV